MRKNRCCKKPCSTKGIVLISAGVGILLAYIMPYYLLITIFGITLIIMGIRYILKK